MRLIVMAAALALVGCGQQAEMEKRVADARLADHEAMKAAMDVEVDRRVKEELARRDAVKGAEPKKPDERKPLRMTEDLFKASVFDRTREEVERKYGLPTKTVEGDGGWDGPYWVYAGEFTTVEGIRRPSAHLYFLNGCVALVALDSK